jgi:DNA-binding IclR family transcriptional regulator
MSAIRALHALEFIAGAGRPLRAIEIARSLNLSPSSANHLLKVMVEWAYLIFDPISKLYYLSPRISKPAEAVNSAYFGQNTLSSLLDATYKTFHLPAALCANQGAFMQVIDFYWPDAGDSLFIPDYVSPQPAPLCPSIGMQLPVFGSCSGAAWLSTQSEERIRASIRLCRRDLGHLADDMDGILARISQIRAQGYAFGGILAESARRSFSVALPRAANGVVLVLALFGQKQEMEEKRDNIVLEMRRLIEQLPQGVGISNSSYPAE